MQSVTFGDTAPRAGGVMHDQRDKIAPSARALRSSVPSSEESSRPPRLIANIGALASLRSLVDFAAFAGSGAVLANLDATLVSGAQRNLTLCFAALLYFCGERYIKTTEASAFVKQGLTQRLLRGAAPQVLAIAILFSIYAVSYPPDSAELAAIMRWLGRWAALGAGTALVTNGIVHALVAHWRSAGVLAQRIAIVGAGEPAERLIAWFQNRTPDLVDVIGIYDDRRRQMGAYPSLKKYFKGGTADLLALSRRSRIDKVILALPHHAENRLLVLLQALKPMAVDIQLCPDLVGFRLPDTGTKTVELGGLPLLNVAPRPLEASQRFAKDVFDRVCALAGLALLLPFFPIVALAIKLESRGPLFFRQERYGLGNTIIKVYKLRTMRADMADPSGGQQTKRNDARVTRVGAFLRKTSIDELPQLFNVLRGDMSLVGPRPLPIGMRIQNRLNHELVTEYAFRHRLKPGLTGWAQVNGLRGAVDTVESLQKRVELDLYYIDNWSVWFDLRILFKTIAVCLAQENAF